MLLILPATVILYRRSKFECFSFLTFCIILIYVFSSWWNWFYGDSFGMRPMVDYYGLFMLVILLMLSSIKQRIWQIVAVSFIGLSLLLNLFQTWQYAEEIIHPDAMNKSAYNYIFLKTGNSYKRCIAATDESFYGLLQKEAFFKTNTNLETQSDDWRTNLYVLTESGSTAAKLTSSVHYGPSFEYQIPDSETGRENIYIKFKTDYFEPLENAAIGALFVVDIKDISNKTIFYKAFRMKRLPDQKVNEWRTGSIGFKIPDFAEGVSSIKFYIWNKEKSTFLLDDLELTFYSYQQ